MFSSEPAPTTADVAQITLPVLVVVGDDDFVTLPHTAPLYAALAAAGPPQTLFPIRRAGTAGS